MAIKTGIDATALNKFAQAVGAGAREVDAMFKVWGRVYLAAMQKRFTTFSRGGGDWPGLEEETIKRKRAKGRKLGKRTKAVRAAKASSGSSVILVDSGALRAALSVGSNGNLFKRIPKGIRVGYSRATHPAGGISFQRLAEIHQVGE